MRQLRTHFIVLYTLRDLFVFVCLPVVVCLSSPPLPPYDPTQSINLSYDI